MLRKIGGAGRRLVRLFQPGARRFGQRRIHQQQADVATNREQQIVEIMRHAGRERAQRLELLRLEQLVLDVHECRVVRDLVNQSANLPLVMPGEHRHRPMPPLRVHALQFLRASLGQHETKRLLQLGALRSVRHVVEQRLARLWCAVQAQPAVLGRKLLPAVVEMSDAQPPVDRVERAIERVDDAAHEISFQQQLVLKFLLRAHVALQRHHAGQLSVAIVDGRDRHLDGIS